MSKPPYDKWNRQANTVKETPKFLPRAKVVRVLPNMEPKEVEVEGKYGKRKMWLLNTSIGLVYFTPVQFVEVTERMRMADFPESGVEYP